MSSRVGNANHVAMVNRPGEADLAARLLEIMGCRPMRIVNSFAGARPVLSADESLIVSEVTPGQWEFELWLQKQLDNSAGAHDCPRAFAESTYAVPQRRTHIGIGSPTLEDWEQTVARVQDAASNDPELKGRIKIVHLSRPEDPDSVAAETGGRAGRTLYQFFLDTDIVSSGLLTFGQVFEIQHFRENDPAYDGPFKPLEKEPI